MYKDKGIKKQNLQYLYDVADNALPNEVITKKKMISSPNAVKIVKRKNESGTTMARSKTKDAHSNNT